MSVSIVDGLLDELGALQKKRKRIDYENTFVPRHMVGQGGIERFYMKKIEERIGVTLEIESVKRKIAGAVA